MRRKEEGRRGERGCGWAYKRRRGSEEKKGERSEREVRGSEEGGKER